MIIRVDFSAEYIRNLQELYSENSIIKEEIEKRIKWFCKKPSDERLEDHPLRGELFGKQAFSITDDIRIVYKWVGKNRVKFLAIGGHSKVYGKKVN